MKPSIHLEICFDVLQFHYSCRSRVISTVLEEGLELNKSFRKIFIEWGPGLITRTPAVHKYIYSKVCQPLTLKPVKYKYWWPHHRFIVNHCLYQVSNHGKEWNHDYQDIKKSVIWIFLSASQRFFYNFLLQNHYLKSSLTDGFISSRHLSGQAFILIIHEENVLNVHDIHLTKWIDY